MKHARRRFPGKSGDRTSANRQWGTVREDYSEGGDAWNYFTHDQVSAAL